MNLLPRRARSSLRRRVLLASVALVAIAGKLAEDDLRRTVRTGTAPPPPSP